MLGFGRGLLSVAFVALLLTISPVMPKPSLPATAAPTTGPCTETQQLHGSQNLNHFDPHRANLTDKDPTDVSSNNRDGITEARCMSASDCLEMAQKYLATSIGGSDPALPLLEKSISLDPTNPRAHKALARAYINYFGAIAGMNLHLSEEQCCRAETACRAAISLVPEDAEAFLLLSQVLNLEIHWGYRSDDSAIETAKRAIGLSPDWPEAYCALQSAYTLANRCDEAMAAFEKEAALTVSKGLQEEIKGGLLDMEPSKSHQWSDLVSIADVCAKAGKERLALSYLRRAAEMAPRDALSRFRAAMLDVKLGDTEAARREYEALTRVCRSTDKFVSYQCDALAKELLDAIEQAAK